MSSWSYQNLEIEQFETKFSHISHCVSRSSDKTLPSCAKKCANEKLTRHLLMKHISSSSKKRFHMQKAPSIFMPISYRIDNILVNIKKRPKNFLFCLYTDWLIESCPSLSKWFDMSKFPEIMENMAKKVWK